MYVDSSSAPPVVTFSDIQPAEANLSEFVRHLEAYLPLFRELSEFRFLYLARTDSHFEKARELFDSIVTIPLGSNPADDLLRYFAIRKSWDQRQYNQITEADLIFRNQAKQRFAAPRFEQLYHGWRAGRLQDADVQEEFPGNGTVHTVQFASQVLKTVGPAPGESEENRWRT
jgi:hypothetical protein